MEASIYNIVVRDENGDHIIYNTLKRCLITLNQNAYATYLLKEGRYLDELVEAGVLVENAAYEQDIQERQFDLDRFSNDWFALCMSPTYECNYNCPYCYEHGANPPGIMSAEVIRKTYEFFEAVYERDHFKKFSLGWYGGEPTLCMDIIEEMTAWFRTFCEDRGIEFTVNILSNCGRIDPAMAERLAAVGVQRLMPTIDGHEELHNRRRVNRTLEDSFRATIDGLHHAADAGISVAANMNADRINMQEFRSLRQRLHDEEGIIIYPSLLKDYRQDYNENDEGFEDGPFELYTREDYSHDIHELFEETDYSAAVLEGLLRPVRNFCRGQLENYYVIDSLGDVYKCEGWMGHKDHVLFSLFDMPDVATMAYTDYNPLRDPKCRDCPVLPLCKGQCEWDRKLLDHVCHIARFSIEDYVLDYRSCFGAAKDPVTVFVPPVSAEDCLAEPFVCDGPNESLWAGTPWYDEDEDGNPTYKKDKHQKSEHPVY